VSGVTAPVEAGTLGGRLWFYSNYHCNLACAYCLTESSPRVARRVLAAADIIALATEAVDLGFTSFGITGGEPFLLPDMPRTVARLAGLRPVVVLSNGTLFTDRLLRRLAPLAGLPVAIQVSLDSADAEVNDELRAPQNHARVSEAIPRLVDAGVGVRIATTSEGLDAGAMERLCALHRSLGVPDDDHVVRPVVRRGRAATGGLGVDVNAADLPPELTITADGAFWSPFGPTVRGQRLDTDLLVTRTTRPLAIPAAAILRLVAGRPPGADAGLNIR
jgi:MoaA/NifB/PqqE/SkfB family radical SAM enzyme